MVGCTLTPEDAYRFAMGMEVTSSTGVPARLNRPLDFLVVSDHAENLGLSPAIAVSDPKLLENEWGKEHRQLGELRVCPCRFSQSTLLCLYPRRPRGRKGIGQFDL
jgi:hypothetical protein